MTLKRIAPVFSLIALLGLTIGGAHAQADSVLTVAPGAAYETIDAAIAAASDGDVIEVRGGQFDAPLLIDKSVTLRGVDQPVIDGHGEGSLVLIAAPDVRFEGFTVRNSGANVNHEDTGIVVQASRVTLADNRVEDVLFGIYFAEGHDGISRGNTVRCYDRELGLRGDGIRVWYSNRVTITGNTAINCRDTLIWYAQDILIENNVFQDGRYGLHFMYSSHATVENNTFEGNSVGSYLMYSQHLTMRGNHMVENRGPSGYGIALKDMDYVTLQDNLLVGNRAGIYIDNSPALYGITNSVTGNFVAYNDIGIAGLPSTARNDVRNNTFLENTQQVSVLGRGNLLANTWSQNFWSNYVGYDGDGDGIGDVPFRAEKLFESLIDGEPALRLFLYSPVSQAIDFAASAFPSLRPDPKVIDEAPAMHYAIPAAAAQSAQSDGLALLLAAGALIVLGSAVVVFGIGIQRGASRTRNPVSTSQHLTPESGAS
ncbi:MAG: nitrous oxide reductase family maturation protein NosD [Chloroflexi bacterium]|nr:nitrous oxide reductase family maturation protein NosD [Chloroflexota bacterium]